MSSTSRGALPHVLALLATGAFAIGVAKEHILWEWWEASGSQLMLLGLGLMALAAFLRAR